ncbi:ATP-binding protein [Klenkia terrae]|uniref:ATP-binding protein n=1 Tax=Klenkia terrae TaxID=1052259 RepID=UPI00361E931A
MTTTPPVPHLLLTTEDDAPGTRAGFRLDRLEMLNWGTFDRRVWTLRADGQNTLLTGDIGSGKSTIVDALSTLLLPAARVSYNEAAGAPTRERDLRSYVQGHWRAERSDTTGAPAPWACARAAPGRRCSRCSATRPWTRPSPSARCSGCARARSASPTGSTWSPTATSRSPVTSPSSAATRPRCAAGCPPGSTSRCSAPSPSTAGSTATGWASPRSRRWTCSTRPSR